MPNDNANAYAMMQVSEQRERLMRMMHKAHSVSSKTGEELAAHWTKNICYYLFARCKAHSPTPEMFGMGLSSIAVAQNYQIKSLKNGIPVPSLYSDKGKKRKNFDRVANVMRDRGNHRLFLASGWLNVKKIASRSGERIVPGKIRNGMVLVEVTDGIFKTIKVTIVNLSRFARTFHSKYSIVPAALEDERQDLAQYISKKTHEDVREILETT